MLVYGISSILTKIYVVIRTRFMCTLDNAAIVLPDLLRFYFINIKFISV